MGVLTVMGCLVGSATRIRSVRFVSAAVVLGVLLCLSASIGSGSALAAGAGQTAPLDPAAGQYVPVTPTKILDTRTGLGVTEGAVQAGASVSISPGGVGGVPSSGVTAVYVAINAITPSASGCLVDFSDDDSNPDNCTAAFQAGQTEVNTDIVGRGWRR